jgi:hypothetical protein
MVDIFREGGWPMYPILSLGGTALVLALWSLRSSHRGLGVMVVGLMASSLLFGLFGTCLGIGESVKHIREVPPESRWIFLIGLSESLRCVSLALALAVPTALALTASVYHARRRTPANDK